MNPVILDDISSKLPASEIMERLRVGKERPRLAAELEELIREAERIGRPKALIGAVKIDETGDDYIVLEGIRFSSRVLAVNTARAEHAFPFVLTCGTELEEWSKGLDSLLYRFWSEEIRIAAMGNAIAAASDYIANSYNLEKTTRMAPGEFDDWPIHEQEPLFRLLGDTESSVGVRLTDSMLMVPTKSASGMFFTTAHTFEACMLCTQTTCNARRAPYDPDLYDKRFRK